MECLDSHVPASDVILRGKHRLRREISTVFSSYINAPVNFSSRGNNNQQLEFPQYGRHHSGTLPKHALHSQPSQGRTKHKESLAENRDELNQYQYSLKIQTAAIFCHGGRGHFARNLTRLPRHLVTPLGGSGPTCCCCRLS